MGSHDIKISQLMKVLNLQYLFFSTEDEMSVYRSLIGKIFKKSVIVSQKPVLKYVWILIF